MEYDEQAAIDFIREKIGQDTRDKFNDDEILNVIDIIWEYYDDNGFCDMSLEDDGPEDLDYEDLLKYVKKMISKDKLCPLTMDDVEKIVDAEMEYEDSLEQ